MTGPSGAKTLANRLIERFPRDAQEKLSQRLETVSLTRRQVVYDGHNPIDYVYFPITCVLSLVQLMENGAMSEAGTIGNEGMTGIGLSMGYRVPLGRVIAQLPGDAARIDTMTLQRLSEEVPAVRHVMHRFGLSFVHQLVQSTGCNQFHSIKQRCARWLLTMHDRSPNDEMALTHEFLAEMLGTRRATITVIVGAMQRAGFIKSTHGRIVIVDPRGLESMSCECYRAVRNKYELLMADESPPHSRGGGEALAATLPRFRS